MALLDMVQGLGMDPNQQGLFGLGARLAAAGGPTQAPMNMGARMGQAGLGFMQDLQQAQQLAVQKKLREMQISKLEDELKTAERMSKIRSKTAKLAEEHIQMLSDQATDQDPMESMARGASQGLGQQYINPRYGLASTLVSGGLEGAYGQGSDDMVKMGLGMVGQGPQKPLKYESMPMAMRAAGQTTGIPHVDQLSPEQAQRSLDYFKQPIQILGTHPQTGQPLTYLTPHASAVQGRPGAAAVFPREAPKPLPQEAQTSMTGAVKIHRQLDIMEQNLKATGGLKGGLGMVQSSKYSMGLLGSPNKKLNEFLVARNSAMHEAQAVIKGVPTEFDIARFESTMPDPRLSPTVNRERLKTARQMADDLMLDKIAYFKGTGNQIPEHVARWAKDRGLNVDQIRPWDQSGDPFARTMQKYSGKMAPKGKAAGPAAQNQDQLLKQARDAINAGKDPEAVKGRLREMGIDPSGL